LGAKVVVLDGVSVGERAVLGAGAVVTKNIPSHTVAVGVPAKVVEALAKAD
jgi:acetyltransferase-like isoleucine patch superfamily enzyme